MVVLVCHLLYACVLFLFVHYEIVQSYTHIYCHRLFETLLNAQNLFCLAYNWYQLLYLTLIEHSDQAKLMDLFTDVTV